MKKDIKKNILPGEQFKDKEIRLYPEKLLINYIKEKGLLDNILNKWQIEYKLVKKEDVYFRGEKVAEIYIYDEIVYFNSQPTRTTRLSSIKTNSVENYKIAVGATKNIREKSGVKRNDKYCVLKFDVKEKLSEDKLYIVYQALENPDTFISIAKEVAFIKEYESKVPQSLIDVVYNKIIQDNMLNRMSATRSFCFYSEHFGCYYTKYYRFDSKTILAYDNTLEFCFSKDCDNCKKEVFEKEENITEMELADILGNIDYITLMYLAHKVGVFENENFQELAENATEIEKLTYQTQKLKYEISKMLKLLGIQSDPENVTAEELENYIKNYIESRQNDIYKEGNTQNATYRESLILGMFKRRK